MTCAIFRGFGFPASNAGDQLRFCNPLVSFEEGESAPVYFVRDLDWSLGSDDQARWITPLDADEIEAFATLVPGTTLQIRPGDGIVLIGEQISTAARSLQMEADRGSLVKFTEYSEPRVRIGVANADSYRDLVRRLTEEAASIFDGELGATTGTALSRRGETALFVLRKCSYSLPTVLAIRQLAAARVTRQRDRDRRLLTRFSRELNLAEDVLDRRVDQHLRHIGNERTPIIRPATEASVPSPFFSRSVEIYSVRGQTLKSLVRARPETITATLKSDVESRALELVLTRIPSTRRASSVLFPHSGTFRRTFKLKKSRSARRPSTDLASAATPYGAVFSNNVQEEYETPISWNKQFGGSIRSTSGGALGKIRFRDMKHADSLHSPGSGRQSSFRIAAGIHDEE